MVVLNLTAGTTTTSAIDFKTILNTNLAMTTTTNDISILVPGIYEIEGIATLTSTASGNYGISIYADGSDSGNSSVALAAAADETTTLPIYDVISVSSATNNSYVTLTLIPTGSPTIVSGTISIKKIS